jgi:hypothetical protein
MHAVRGRLALAISNATLRVIGFLRQPVRFAAKRAAMRIVAVKNAVAVGTLR